MSRITPQARAFFVAAAGVLRTIEACRPLLERLRHEERRDIPAPEAIRLVQPDRAFVRTVHFKRDLAATALVRAAFDFCEQCVADPATLALRVYREIVDVHGQLAREGGNAANADRYADGSVAEVAEENFGVGIGEQAARHFGARMVGERRVLTAWTARVGVDDIDYGVSVSRVC